MQQQGYDVTPQVDSKTAPSDLEAKKEQLYLEEELRFFAEHRKNLEDQRKLRNWFTKICTIFLVIWCFVIVVVALLSGSNCVPITVPDKVLMILAGSTTAGIIGLVAIVGRGLFKSPAE